MTGVEKFLCHSMHVKKKKTNNSKNRNESRITGYSFCYEFLLLSPFIRILLKKKGIYPSTTKPL